MAERDDNTSGAFGLASPGGEPEDEARIGLRRDRLLAALHVLGLLAQGLAQVPIYVKPLDASVAGPALALATELRAAGLRVELDLAGGRIGKQFERAGKRGSKIALVVGSDELAAGVVQVKDLASGEQAKVARAELIDDLRRRLA